MIHTVNITQTGADNVPWYALLMKYDQPSQQLLIVKFENYILHCDVPAMVRGSLLLRSYEKCFDLNDAIQTFYMEIGRAAAITGYSTIFSSRDRPIYDSMTAAMVKRFPKADAQIFAEAAVKRAYDQVNGSPAKVSAREMELQREIDRMRDAKRAKNRKRHQRQLIMDEHGVRPTPNVR